MEGKYPVVTLCGSTRFKDQFVEAQKRLTLEGNIVISVGLFGHSGDQEVWDGMYEGTLSKTKEMLDDMHKQKIDMADSIYVINVGGYIGESTRSEIEYAKARGKEVRYLEPWDNDKTNPRFSFPEKHVMRLSFADLDNPAKRKLIPSVPGFYKVFLPARMELNIATETRANHKCYSRKEQMTKEFLEDVWRPLEGASALNDRVLYIGKGLNVRDRLNQYKRVMFNQGLNHKGGVYICQIIGCEALEVEWYEYRSEIVTQFLNLSKEDRKLKHPLGEAVDKELKQVEHEMILEYCNKHKGLLPFANRER